MLDWTWYKFKEIKNELINYSRRLFEGLSPFDDRIKFVIINNITLIKNLITIYDTFIGIKMSPDGLISLNKKLSVLQAFELYCEHMVLCIENGLLPEQIGNHKSFMLQTAFIYLFLKLT